jgi:RNA polymerase sigma-70 factor (ECF subfamily)
MASNSPPALTSVLPAIEIDRAFEEGRRAWPNIRLEVPGFSQRLHAMGVASEDLRERAGDLYLAVACALGAEGAVKAFKAAHDVVIGGALRRMQLDRATMQDALQAIDVRLFSGERPRIESYSGKGPLAAWLRVLAVRVALDTVGEAGQTVPVAEPTPSVASLLERASPELMAMRSEHKVALAAALEDAVAALPARDKTILRLHLVDGLTLSGIGALYGVNRSTTMRWLAKIRLQVVAHLRRTLGRDLQLTVSEIHSLTALYSGELSLSLAHLLAPAPDDLESPR